MMDRPFDLVADACGNSRCVIADEIIEDEVAVSEKLFSHFYQGRNF